MSRAAGARSCPSSVSNDHASRSLNVLHARTTRRSARTVSGRAARLVSTALVAGLVGVPVLVPQTASADPAPTTNEQARPVGDFLNSLGVNVHMGYGKTRYADANGTVDALRQIGFTHVRENFHPDNTAEHARLRTLQDAGIHFTFVIPRPDEPTGKDPAQ